MPANVANYRAIREELAASGAELVAVSKIRPPEDILALYAEGHRDFGENYVQELNSKQPSLPGDIRWHFIGHLQSNKVKYIAPFISLIHGVDSLNLLKEINKQALKHNRIIDCLLQIHIATEETKFGMNAEEAEEAMNASSAFPGVRIRGMMGMASFTDNTELVRAEFRTLVQVYEGFRNATDRPHYNILSMGMSGDYKLAVEEGSTMVRIGSLLFGARIPS